jgi:hypothetical protein
MNRGAAPLTLTCSAQTWSSERPVGVASNFPVPATIEEVFRSRPPGQDGWRPNHYHRQYAGFLREGRRVIYVNAVGHEIGEELSGSLLGELDTRARVICDGGEITFGAVFDPQSGRFDSFAFNGAL